MVRNSSVFQCSTYLSKIKSDSKPHQNPSPYLQHEIYHDKPIHFLDGLPQDAQSYMLWGRLNYHGKFLQHKNSKHEVADIAQRICRMWLYRLRLIQNSLSFTFSMRRYIWWRLRLRIRQRIHCSLKLFELTRKGSEINRRKIDYLTKVINENNIFLKFWGLKWQWARITTFQ